ncbi:MAG: alkaline phosphatase family protein, partial [Halobacteriovoraceae bacterium]|nr:alkaline phosphatase family protein [Halobacteriovoraceae bacterium]
LKSSFGSDRHVYGNTRPFKFCFGSCHFQGRPQDHWKTIAKRKPDLWLWLGYNIYGDTRDINLLEQKYSLVTEGPYGDFRKQIPLYGIWDDHDFGEDGANREYPHKEASQKLHLDFLGVDDFDPRRQQKGIYHTREEAGGRIKFYFLDTRYFKSPEKGEDQDLLGEDQWRWLEKEIDYSRADVNIFVTPIGFLLNRLFVTEDWAEYPREKQRLLDKINSASLSGVFFMSGDKHFGAFIKRGYESNGKKVDFHEFQSSGLTHTAGKSVLRLVGKFYGKKNCVLERNFAEAQIYFEQDAIHMTWIIHSLERRRIRSRNYYLNSEKNWIRA